MELIPSSQLLQSRGFGIFSTPQKKKKISRGRSGENPFPKWEFFFFGEKNPIFGAILLHSRGLGMRPGCSCWVCFQIFPNSPQILAEPAPGQPKKMGKKRVFFHFIFPPKIWKNPTEKQGKKRFFFFPGDFFFCWKLLVQDMENFCSKPEKKKKSFPAYFSSTGCVEKIPFQARGKLIFHLFLQNSGKVLLKTRENCVSFFFSRLFFLLGHPSQG